MGKPKCLYCGEAAIVYVPNPDGKYPYCSSEHATQHKNDSFARGIYWRVAYKLDTGEMEILPITPDRPTPVRQP